MSGFKDLSLPEGVGPQDVGLIVVDHGSKRQASNDTFMQIVERLAGRGEGAIVEPAHMELAEPSIAQAFARCVQRGAKLVVCHPYFLLPGRHWDRDIPALMQEAAQSHPGVRWLVTAPLGVHDALLDVILQRVQQCMAHAAGQAEACPLCEGTGRCAFVEG